MFAYLIDHCDMENLELMAVMVKKNWFCRNTVAHGGDFAHHNQVFHESHISIKDFVSINSKDQATQSSIVEEPPLLWQPPHLGMYKVNWDVVVDIAHGRIGIGIIIRDYISVVLTTCSMTQCCLVEPVVAEAIAAIYVVDFCRELVFFFFRYNYGGRRSTNCQCSQNGR
jgi:hypothetical protein